MHQASRPQEVLEITLFRLPNYMTDVQDIQRRLIELDVEHRDLDAVIDLLILDGHHDQLQLRRLKKRKLQLKDYITLLKMQLVPDVPA
jgi:hypothetical protein